MRYKILNTEVDRDVFVYLQNLHYTGVKCGDLGCYIFSDSTKNIVENISFVLEDYDESSSLRYIDIFNKTWCDRIVFKNNVVLSCEKSEEFVYYTCGEDFTHIDESEITSMYKNSLELCNSCNSQIQSFNDWCLSKEYKKHHSRMIKLSDSTCEVKDIMEVLQLTRSVNIITMPFMNTLKSKEELLSFINEHDNVKHIIMNLKGEYEVICVEECMVFDINEEDVNNV